MQKSNSLKLFHKKALWKLFKKIQLLVPLDLYFSSKAIFQFSPPEKPSNHWKMCFVFATNVRELKQVSKLFYYYTIQWPLLYKLVLLELEKIQTWIF